MRSIILVALVSVLGAYAQNSKYCDPKLCTDSWGRVKNHIACPGNQVDECGGTRRVIPLAGDFQQIILNKHNTYRSTLAQGKLPNFKPAAKMPTIEWDEELAQIAAVNAAQCNFDHDDCRNTAAYGFAGQNLAWSSNQKTDQSALEAGVDGWWAEYSVTYESDINAYPQDSNGRMIGHFTQMANDRVNRMGCAFVAYGPANQRYLVCNYSLTNMLKKKVYTQGAAGSGCTKGTNSAYPGLCSTQEPITPTP